MTKTSHSAAEESNLITATGNPRRRSWNPWATFSKQNRQTFAGIKSVMNSNPMTIRCN